MAADSGDDYPVADLALARQAHGECPETAGSRGEDFAGVVSSPT
jgi:hypothetical protein